MPHDIRLYANGSLNAESGGESTKNKIEGDLIRRYYKAIKSANAVLAINETKNKIQNYIGRNTLLEISFAHVLNKKIFLLNPIPKIKFYRSEIKAMRPIILNGDLSKIK